MKQETIGIIEYPKWLQPRVPSRLNRYLGRGSFAIVVESIKRSSEAVGTIDLDGGMRLWWNACK